MRQITQTLNQSGPRRFRELLVGSGIVCLPGMSDGLSARLVEMAGFDGAYLSGGALARGMGHADIGLVTLTELEQRVRNIAEVCGLPFIVDLDSGFGGALNLGLAVSRIQRAGAAGLHIDDFEVPRRFRNPARNLLPIDVMQKRLKLALAARVDNDFAIIGRTDAAAYVGLDAAIDRANAFADVGVDLVYVEHVLDRASIEAVATRVRGAKLISIVSGKGDALSAGELAAMGYKVVTWPAECQFGAIDGSLRLLNALREHGVPATPTTGFDERDRIVGAPEAREIEVEYLQ